MRIFLHSMFKMQFFVILTHYASRHARSARLGAHSMKAKKQSPTMVQRRFQPLWSFTLAPRELLLLLLLVSSVPVYTPPLSAAAESGPLRSMLPLGAALLLPNESSPASFQTASFAHDGRSLRCCRSCCCWFCCCC